jgi:hypothetical protein
MKCGRDTENEQYFCAHCSESMQAYPVKPNAPVHLPKRPVAEEPVKRRRRRLFPEETIEHLRSAVRWEAATIVVLLIALFIVSTLLAWEWLQPQGYSIPDFGRNYTITADYTP